MSRTTIDRKRLALVLACADASRAFRTTDAAARQRALDAHEALRAYDAKRKS